MRMAQASDWPLIMTTGTNVDYAEGRVRDRIVASGRERRRGGGRDRRVGRMSIHPARAASDGVDAKRGLRCIGRMKAGANVLREAGAHGRYLHFLRT